MPLHNSSGMNLTVLVSQFIQFRKVEQTSDDEVRSHWSFRSDTINAKPLTPYLELKSLVLTSHADIGFHLTI